MTPPQRTFNIQLMLAEELPWVMENKHNISPDDYWGDWGLRMRKKNRAFFEDSPMFPLPAKEFAEKHKDKFVLSGNMTFGERLYFGSHFQLSEDFHIYLTYSVKEHPDQLVVFVKTIASDPSISRDFVLEHKDMFIDPNETGTLGFSGFGG